MLRADRGRWNTGSEASYRFQWRRCLPDGSACVDIAKATDAIYVVRNSDVGHTLRVAVTATTKQGSGLAISAPTGIVTALPPDAPHNSVPPAISGTVTQGQVLTASPGTWTGSMPIAFTYRWRRCEASGGACQNRPVFTPTYKLSSADAGRALRVLVSARNATGTAAALSDPTATVAGPTKPAPVRPQNTSAPKLAGSVQEGQTLKGDRGSWTNNPSRFEYSWIRCDRAGALCNEIVGAHSTNYRLSSADVGHTIRFKVTARNVAGSTIALSAASGPVAAAPKPPTAVAPVNQTRPSISGSVKEANTLTGNRGTWSNDPTDYDYVWRRCNTNGESCDDIGGAHATTYRLTGADVGHRIRFRVTAKNAAGSSTATSAASGVVSASDRPGNLTPPTISGTPQLGRTLAGGRGSWSHNPVSFDTAWLRCDRTGGSCAAIAGARGSAYVLTSADVGNTLRVRVTATNSAGSTTATSVPTAVVQGTPSPPPPPSRGNGCPPGGNPDQVANIKAPARLLIDSLQSSPRVVTRATTTIVLRFHVSSTCGGSVQGALVYATATPFNQFTIPPEAQSGADGWATLVFRRLRGFPASPRQQLIALFVRARKPGESLLSGISTRRLVSIPVDLNR